MNESLKRRAHLHGNSITNNLVVASYCVMRHQQSLVSRTKVRPHTHTLMTDEMNFVYHCVDTLALFARFILIHFSLISIGANHLSQCECPIVVTFSVYCTINEWINI